MFEDNGLFRFYYILLTVASIIIPGPIIPMIGAVLLIVLCIYKFKRAKESPEGFHSLMLEIVFIVILIIIEVAFFALRISAENSVKVNKYSTESSQEYTISDLADITIETYKLMNPSVFDGKTEVSKIRGDFKDFIQDYWEVDDITIKGNKIICTIDDQKVAFSVSKKNITYSQIK